MTVRELGAQLIPLEDDVLSLEQPCFKELFLVFHGLVSLIKCFLQSSQPLLAL